MTALKYWDGSNWVTIGSIPGQAGILATQRKAGVTPGSSGQFGVTQGSLWDGVGAAAQPIRITYTPAVDCYWEVIGYIGQMQKHDAAYHYGAAQLMISPADADGVSAGASYVQHQYGGVQTLMAYVPRRIFRLKAGVTYTAWIQFGMGGGTWSYSTSQDYLFIEGKAWPLISNTPPPAPAGSTPLLSALPSVPVNGQEIYYQTSAMLIDGVMWRLRYNSNSASAYKWEFLGGAPLFNERAIEESYIGAPANTWLNVNANDPKLNVPLAGEYDCDLGAALASSVGHVHLGLAMGATEPSVTANAKPALVAASGSWVPVNHHRRVIVANVSDVLYHRYRQAVAGTIYRMAAYLSVTPVRVG